MKRFLYTFLVAFFLTLVFSRVAFASIGVGVGTGKIEVEEMLKSGMSYNLPPLTVLNTGDEPSDYEVSTAYHEGQEQLAPPKDWFVFTPSKFYLEPGEVQTVEIKLNLPLQTTPGDYFAYLEGFPAKKAHSGGAAIGVAAAAKLYFSVEPASFLEALYYKVANFWTNYSPLTNIAAGTVVALTLLRLFSRFFNIQIGIKKRGSSEDEKQ